jgi:hypothetical protein
MFRIPAEFEHVPLGNPEVLEQFPRSVGRAFRLFTPERGGEMGNGLAEIGMGAAPFEKFHELVAQSLNRVHGRIIDL